ncbi:MerR family transcriptional regulator [Lusitaniella coriacea LEGE 07157]|uniref:MerR family transcriptional regulator n=1 Tax=Lusitaniella coriacea LEGE 07157 TaxID=945747 RepID=A0A8J7DZU3_9CYAN|nr:MerR family transcriptional regulator [Lusitaniella coriacea]MBE9118746.1 MerR family transcriptional regulator [Lusitaniella coriacea LEGE 07157]
MNEQTAWKIGDLANKVGLSVRTLRYYDELGLLKPSKRTDVGHRLYLEGDVIRLQQIVSLRQLGFSLEEIKACLEKPDFSPVATIQTHLAKLCEQIKLQQQLVRLLEKISATLQTSESVSIGDFIHVIEVTTMVEELFNQYYTPDQLESLDRRKEMVGDRATAQVQQEWQDLYAKVREAMNDGIDPTDKRVLALAKRSNELLEQFTGGDEGILQSLNAMANAEFSTLQEQFGFPEPELFEYLGQAQAALKKS